jgi:hypothetical protein
LARRLAGRWLDPRTPRRTAFSRTTHCDWRLFPEVFAIGPRPSGRRLSFDKPDSFARRWKRHFFVGQ